MLKKYLLVAAVFLSGRPAYAWDPVERCNQEPFGLEDARGRNA